jgi:hypothetical protein
MGSFSDYCFCVNVRRIKFITNHCLYTKRSVTSNNLTGRFEQLHFFSTFMCYRKVMYHSNTCFIHVKICVQNNLTFLSQFSGIVLSFKQPIENCSLHHCLLVCCNKLVLIPSASTFSVIFLTNKAQQQRKKITAATKQR